MNLGRYVLWDWGKGGGVVKRCVGARYAELTRFWEVHQLKGEVQAGIVQEISINCGKLEFPVEYIAVELRQGGGEGGASEEEGNAEDVEEPVAGPSRCRPRGVAGCGFGAPMVGARNSDSRNSDMGSTGWCRP